MSGWWFYSFLFCIALGYTALSTQSLDGILILYVFHYKKEQSRLGALIKTIQTLARIGYLMIYQKIAKNVEIVNKNEYDIHYVLGSQFYKMRISCLKGPKSKNVLQIIDQDDNDVTVDVVRYMGPNEDWHGIVYTPFRLKYDQLTFNMSNGTSIIFEKEQPIVFQDKTRSIVE